jgi:hypothetical protein
MMLHKCFEVDASLPQHDISLEKVVLADTYLDHRDPTWSCQIEATPSDSSAVKAQTGQSDAQHCSPL